MKKREVGKSEETDIGVMIEGARSRQENSTNAEEGWEKCCNDRLRINVGEGEKSNA